VDGLADKEKASEGSTGVTKRARLFCNTARGGSHAAQPTGGGGRETDIDEVSVRLGSRRHVRRQLSCRPYDPASSSRSPLKGSSVAVVDFGCSARFLTEARGERAESEVFDDVARTRSPDMTACLLLSRGLAIRRRSRTKKRVRQELLCRVPFHLGVFWAQLLAMATGRRRSLSRGTAARATIPVPRPPPRTVLVTSQNHGFAVGSARRVGP